MKGSSVSQRGIPAYPNLPSAPSQVGYDRQGEEKGAAFAGGAPAPNPAPMQLARGARDRQAEASAADPAGVGVVHPIEAFPDPRQIFGRNADPLVAHCDEQEAPVRMLGR